MYIFHMPRFILSLTSIRHICDIKDLPLCLSDSDCEGNSICETATDSWLLDIEVRPLMICVLRVARGTLNDANDLGSKRHGIRLC